MTRGVPLAIAHAPSMRALRLLAIAYAGVCMALVTFGIFAGGAGTGRTMS